MTPSDITIIVAAILALLFLIDYGFLSPWYRSALGWVITLYAGATVSLLALLVHGIVFRQRIPEPIRFVIGAAVCAALLAKILILHRERAIGRREREARRQRR